MTYVKKLQLCAIFLGSALAVVACRDSNIVPDVEPEETTEMLNFRVPAGAVNDWSRAGVDNFDWSSLKRIDRRYYPNDFIEKDVDYEPNIPDLEKNLALGASNPLWPFNSYYREKHNRDDEHNGPYLTYNDIIPLETEAGEVKGRIEVKQEPLTDEILARLTSPSQPYPSRTVLVDNSNYKDMYQNIGVTGICYYPDKDNPVPFDENDSRISIMNNERVAFGGEDTWNTTSGRWYWNELGPDPEINYIRFFAYAPYDKMQDSDWFHWVSPTSVSTPSFAYKIPERVTDHVDIAAKAVDAPGDFYRTVPLQFEHLLTGVRFLVDDEYMANHITKISIIGVHGEGEYHYSLNPDDISTTTDHNLVQRGTWTSTDEPEAIFELSRANGDFSKAVLDEYDKDGDRWSITDNEHLLLMLPQQLPQGAYVKIEFDAEAGYDHPLIGRLNFKEVSTTPSSPSDYPDNTSPDGDGPAHTWKQGYIVTYFIQTFDIRYVLKLVKDGGLYPYSGGYDDFTVVSYAVYYTNGSHEFKKIVPVPWEPQFYDEAGNAIAKPSWVNVTYDRPEGLPKEWLQGADLDPSDLTAILNQPEDFLEKLVLHGHVEVLPQGGTKEDPHYRAMRDATPVGTADNPVDLSGGTEGAPGSTANCYIINAPGYYRFPLVYGNAYKNGAVNTPAFTSEQYHSFKTHTDFEISALPTPWLKSAATITDAALISTNAENAVQLVKLTDDYLTIYIEPYYIDQGNTTLCVRDDQYNIMWSWHIWTTDYNPYIQSNLRRVPTTRQGDYFDFMTIDLGYHYPDLSGSTTDRRVMWRPTQQCRHRGDILIRTTPNYYHIQQEGTESTRGYAPYYNWGRKDPLLHSVHSRFENESFADQQFRLFPSDSYFFLTYSYRRLIDNTGLMSNGMALVQGHHYFWQPTPAQAVMIPWFMPGFYNATNPGGTNNHTYVPWWAGDYTYQPNLASNPLDARLVHGYGSPSHDMQVYYNDLWCAGQNVPNYLSDPTNPRNVVKTVYDPCPPGFCVPANRAFDYINEARALTSRHPAWNFRTDYLMAKQHLSVGYTFYIDQDAWATDDMSDEATINFPAATWLSSRIGSNGHWTLPWLSAYMNRNCSLWTADISSLIVQYDVIRVGSIFNITDNFVRDQMAGGMNGAGVTSQNVVATQGVSTQFLNSSNGRHVRAVKEMD